MDAVLSVAPWDKNGLVSSEMAVAASSIVYGRLVSTISEKITLAFHTRLCLPPHHSHNLTALTLPPLSNFPQTHMHLSQTSTHSYAQPHISHTRQNSSTMSPQRSQSQQPQPASSPVGLRLRADSDSFKTTAPPAYAPTSTPIARDHLPLSFGAEFELIIRPTDGLVPDFDASTRSLRDFNNTLLKRIADLLSRAGMPANAYDPCEDDKPDYSKWNVMLDGSLSKKHMRDGFCKKWL